MSAGEWVAAHLRQLADVCPGQPQPEALTIHDLLAAPAQVMVDGGEDGAAWSHIDLPGQVVSTEQGDHHWALSVYCPDGNLVVTIGGPR